MTKVKQAVIMVGGKGTRLLPLTETRPKPVLPVADRPCIWYLLRSMARAGIEEVILACGYKPGMMEVLGDGSDLGIHIEYSYEDEPRGTGGAIKLVEDRLDETFVAANGDVFADLDVAGEIATHIRTGAEITDLLIPVDNPCDYGIACVDDDLRITAFKDKPKPEEVFSNLINAGVYVVQKTAIELVPENTFFDFSMDLIPKVIAEGRRVQGHRLDGLWMDVGRPHDLLRANLCVAESEFGSEGPGTASGCKRKGTTYVGHGSEVSDSVIDASVVSGGCKVSSSTIVNSLVMPGCRIEGVTLTNSILGEGCIIGKGATIRDEVLRDGTVVPDGTTIIGDRVV